MSTSPTHIAVIGGTGLAGVPLLTEFVRSGIPTRVLARQPALVQARFPELTVVQGSMVRRDDVQRAIAGATTVVLLTPLGGNNNSTGELEAAQSVLAAAQAEHTPHIIYTSLISAGRVTGIPAMDVKSHIEQMLAASGIGWSSLRAGAYLDYFIGRSSTIWRYGIVPAFTKQGVCTQYTAQSDIARAIVAFHTTSKAVNGSVDVIDTMPYTARDLVMLIRRLLKRNLHAFPGGLAVPIITALLPVVRSMRPKQATVLTVMRYLSTHDFLGQSIPITTVLPSFPMTTVELYVRALLNRSNNRAKILSSG